MLVLPSLLRERLCLKFFEVYRKHNQPILCASRRKYRKLYFRTVYLTGKLTKRSQKVHRIHPTRTGEGIPVINGEHVLLADTPAIFIEAAVRIIQDVTLAERLSKNCRLLIEQRYSLAQLCREAMD